MTIHPTTSGKYGFRLATSRYGNGETVELFQHIEPTERNREFLTEGHWSKCSEWTREAMADLEPGTRLAIDWGQGWFVEGADHDELIEFAIG